MRTLGAQFNENISKATDSVSVYMNVILIQMAYGNLK